MVYFLLRRGEAEIPEGAKEELRSCTNDPALPRGLPAEGLMWGFASLQISMSACVTFCLNWVAGTRLGGFVVPGSFLCLGAGRTCNAEGRRRDGSRSGAEHRKGCPAPLLPSPGLRSDPAQCNKSLPKVIFWSSKGP